MRTVRADLLSHVGGSPSATQRALIDRAVWLTLHTALLDKRIAEGRSLTEHDSRTYLSWSNSLSRTLRQLGMHAPKPRPATLADYLAQQAKVS